MVQDTLRKLCKKMMSFQKSEDHKDSVTYWEEGLWTISRVEPSELPSVDEDHTTVTASRRSLKLQRDGDIISSRDVQVEGSAVGLDSGTGETSVWRTCGFGS